MTEDEAFERDVDRWIAEAVDERRIDFAALVRSLPGVDPSFVRSRIKVAPEDVRTRIHWRVVDAQGEPPSRGLPVPHPLDFDWRFTLSTLNELANEVVSLGTRLTLLGTPSLWLALLGRVPPERVRLLDANPIISTVANTVKASQQVLTVDILRDHVPPLLSDVVVADPPWYPEALRGFLWVGASLLRAKGLLLLSVPAVGTRPGISHERDQILDLAKSLGLILRSTRSGALSYASPPFERAALRMLGLGDYVPTNWRRGDLLVFERTAGQLLVPRPVLQVRRWTERVIEGVRIQVDTEAPAASLDPRLIPLVTDDVLPSVSRRDERRRTVRVWTSGNRVFGCAAPARLVNVMDEIITGCSIECREDKSAAESILALVRRERTEYIAFHGGLLV